MKILCITRSWSLFAALFLLPFFSEGTERLKIAEAWAPVIFQELDLEFTHPLTGFNPVDHIVGLNFDGNTDLRDNGDTIFSLAPSREVELLNHIPLYFSLIETETHYYFNYILYHAVDRGGNAHSHDTENIWVIVEKKGGPYGTLVGHIANAHGLAMIYLQDEQEEKKWRQKLPKDMRRRLAPLVDKFSVEHHSKGRPDYVKRPNSLSLKFFVASRTHAIYKLNEEVWKSSGVAGSIYYPRSCTECPAQILGGEGHPYYLVDWDHWMDEILTDLEDKTIAMKDITKYFSAIEVGHALQKSIYIERNLPSYLAASYKDNSPAGLIFYRSSLGLQRDLITPAEKHLEFIGAKAKISRVYLQNTYLRVRGVANVKRPEYVFQNSSMMQLIKNLLGLTRD